MTETTKRLHITPLTPELLDSVLAPSVRPSATDVSFHSIQTFPENSYGYVTLPAMEADKLKKKLHGSILKGKKFKVEEARPKKRSREEETEEETVGKQPTPEKKKSKKRKSENGVLEGYELPSDRHVKRGWTEPASAKKEKRQKGDKKRQKDDKKPKTQAKSKYTENAECLFRTKTPANRTSVEPPEQKKEKKSKKTKAPNEVTVHEFSKTVTHPSFLRAEAGSNSVSTEFVEGKGWVDSEGNVKEPASEKITKSSKKPGQKEGVKATVKSKKESSEVSTETSKKNKKATKAEESSEESDTDWTSSSGSSDEESSDSESEDVSADTSGEEASDGENEKSNASSEAEDKPASSNKDNSSVADSDEDKGDDSKEKPPTEEKTEVHPLEALFKRPAPKEAEKEKAAEENTQFTFFGGEDLEDEDGDIEMATVEPQTPFTKRDLQERGLRSAAPTPDTALPNRTTFITHDDDDEEEEEDEEGDDEEYYGKSSTKDADRTNDSGPKDESDFAKWFWEHRGENNRAWKKRRRDAAKEKRQRENRKKGLKGRS
ncbi:hypothetical protein DTO217A2_4007 [Paecilomyces variotii]|nr:hypothetical protein DTO217A2_4007 [Paecilomyces variotii]